MINVRKNYYGKVPEFYPEIPQHEKGIARNASGVEIGHERRVTVLESKQVKARRKQIQAECGLDANLRPIVKSRTKFKEGMCGDPVYYREQLGDDILGWEEL